MCISLVFAVIMSNYAKRMAFLSARIFGEVARPTTSQAMKVVQIFSEQPLNKRKDVVEWYPKHPQINILMSKLRHLGLYR